MANNRTAAPGLGGSPRTVARSRIGVASGSSPRMRTGASTIRWPRSPGLSTSTTQASITVGSAIAGAIGAATRSARTFAPASPRNRQATSINGRVTVRPRPANRAPSHTPVASRAATASGHRGGSDLRAK